MKIQFFLLFAVIAFGLVGCYDSKERLQEDIDAICQKWVPDKREGLCEIAIEKVRGPEVVVVGETIYPGAKQEILDVLKKQGCNPDDRIVVLPADTLRKRWALVNLSVANLRSEPSYSAEMVSQVLLGTPVRVLKKQNDWSLIQGPDRYIAWITNASLTYCSEEEIKAWQNSERVVFLGNTDVIRAQDGEILADVVMGNIIEKIEETESRVWVKLPRGERGYLQTEDVKDFDQWRNEVSLSADKLVRDGRALMGIPYLWGGTSVRGIDCSGFMKTIFFQNGIVLARDASLQIRYGTEITYNEGYGAFEVGDLLFFGTLSPYRVTHVGMYIGDSEYIHEAGRVKVNSLDSARSNYNQYREASLVGVRRYLGLPSQEGIRSLNDHSWY